MKEKPIAILREVCGLIQEVLGTLSTFANRLE